MYLFNSNGYWLIGSDPNAFAGKMYVQQGSSSLTPPATGWYYWDGHNWTQDNQLTVLGETLNPVNANKCNERKYIQMLSW